MELVMWQKTKSLFDRTKELEIRTCIIAALFCFFAGAALNEVRERFAQPRWLDNAAHAGQASFAGGAGLRGGYDFVDLVKTLQPVVVNISTRQTSESVSSRPESPRGDQDPAMDFWHKFFGNRLPRGQLPAKSLGSGFIIDNRGLILTNNHVIEDADEIIVKLADSREFRAKTVGIDPKTDIAVVRIDARGELPVAILGDSDALEVGEWVVAIGNAFGLDNTVTSGIISAKGRQIGAGPYDNFIQTDASINPGNSGGPLINLRGEVVGINTAIYSQTGGSIGIGFATPINLVKQLLPQLEEKGRVTRGWMGVSVQKISPEIADSLGLKEPKGALVADVKGGGPADRAGMKPGDVIIGFDEKEIKDANDLPMLVANTRVDTKSRVKVLRAGKEMVLNVTIGELKDEAVAASMPAEGGLGLTLQKMRPDMGRAMGMDKAEGLAVTGVEPGSAADEAGVQQGDIILQVDRKPVHDLPDYQRAIKNAGRRKSILLLVRRGENSLFLALRSR
jgi:serine protease Do